MSALKQNEIMRSWPENATPLLSICCITYNHEHYIRQAIEGFLMQETDFPFEVLIHDDASTDGTTEIVLEYAERYPDIIKPIIQLENQYSKVTLVIPIFVFPKAKGKYIALCDGDDYWTDKTKLQKQVSFLESNSDYAITYADCQPFDENGDLQKFSGWGKCDLEPRELSRSAPIYTLTACFRNIFGDIPQDLLSARCGDIVIWSLLGAHGRGKYLSDIKPSAYRVHEGGIFSKNVTRQKAEMLLITYNALFAHHMRQGDVETAHYFRDRALLLSLRAIGISRLMTVFTKSLTNRLLKRCRSMLD